MTRRRFESGRTGDRDAARAADVTGLSGGIFGEDGEEGTASPGSAPRTITEICSMPMSGSVGSKILAPARASDHQSLLPGMPLNGPTMSLVIHPP
ncbi:hypothetical protein GCM10011390_26300 [Aureimonas endophytica]|uniref:Uncharacterized protein n=1 Tax=Aureimonas endophytica TaxID=2027858 RepID=A0A916ZN74_9HYPH|nr:hypothetical protein GCM10011390_26300 [Aureimonas endophytica]